MSDDTDTEESPEVVQHKLMIIRKQVMMLMDEMKRIFGPQMKLTFVARHPENPEIHSLLTEETDFDIFITALRAMNKPQVIPKDVAGSA